MGHPSCPSSSSSSPVPYRRRRRKSHDAAGRQLCLKLVVHNDLFTPPRRRRQRPPKKTKGSSSFSQKKKKTRWARAFQGVNLPPSLKEKRDGQDPSSYSIFLMSSSRKLHVCWTYTNKLAPGVCNAI